MPNNDIQVKTTKLNADLASLLNTQIFNEGCGSFIFPEKLKFTENSTVYKKKSKKENDILHVFHQHFPKYLQDILITKYMTVLIIN